MVKGHYLFRDDVFIELNLRFTVLNCAAQFAKGIQKD